MRVFGDVLRELRQTKKLTMKELGEKIGLTESAVSMYERNVRRPNYEKLEKIADFFNVDMEYLLGKSNIPNRHTSSQITADINEDIMLILRAVKKMSEKDRKRMIQMLKIAFQEEFREDYLDE